MRITVVSEAQTARAAAALAAHLHPNVTVAFTGDLGAGKTTFIRYLCRALGVTEDVTSPTFSIMNEYRGVYPVYHYDMYRLSGADALEELGFYEFAANGVSLVEWSENVADGLEGEIIHVDIALEGETRVITIPEIEVL